MIRFPFGEDVIEFDDNVEFFAGYKNEFQYSGMMTAIRLKNELSKCKSIEEILNKTPALFDVAMSVVIDEAVNVLMDNGILEYDEKRIRKILGDKIEVESYSEYNSLLKRYNVINENEKHHSEQKEYYRVNRSRWQGGGFGIGGAVKGAVKAGMMNMATDSIRGIGDAITDAGDKSAFSKERQGLLNENAVTGLASVSICCTEIIMSMLFDVLGKYKEKNSNLYRNAERADAIFGNLTKIADVNQQKSFLKQIIELNPFEWNYMEFLFYHHESLGIPYADVKRVAKYVDSMETSQFTREFFLGTTVKKALNGIPTQEAYDKLKKAAIEEQYIEEDLSLIPQDSIFDVEIPSTTIISLAVLALKIKFTSMELAINKVKTDSSFELQETYRAIVGICIQHKLLEISEKLRLKEDLVSDAEDCKNLIKLLAQLQKKYEEACNVDGEKFNRLETANQYRNDLQKFEMVYKAGTSYAEYDSAQLDVVVRCIHRIEFYTSNIDKKIEELENRLDFLLHHEETDAFIQGKELCQVFSFVETPDMYVYGGDQFLPNASKAKNNGTIKKNEPEPFPIVVYNLSTGNSIKGFVLTDRFFYDLNGILGFGAKAIELNKIVGIKTNAGMIEFVTSENQRYKVKFSNDFNSEKFAELLGTALHISAENIQQGAQNVTPAEEGENVTSKFSKTFSSFFTKSSQIKRCPGCGNIVGADDLFCGSCGSKL